jgi:hypothetical protein
MIILDIRLLDDAQNIDILHYFSFKQNTSSMVETPLFWQQKGHEP